MVLPFLKLIVLSMTVSYLVDSTIAVPSPAPMDELGDLAPIPRRSRKKSEAYRSSVHQSGANTYRPMGAREREAFYASYTGPNFREQMQLPGHKQYEQAAELHALDESGSRFGDHSVHSTVKHSSSQRRTNDYSAYAHDSFHQNGASLDFSGLNLNDAEEQVHKVRSSSGSLNQRNTSRKESMRKGKVPDIQVLSDSEGDYDESGEDTFRSLQQRARPKSERLKDKSIWRRVAPEKQREILYLISHGYGIANADADWTLEKNLSEKLRKLLTSSNMDKVMSALAALFPYRVSALSWADELAEGESQHLVKQTVRYSQVPEDQVRAFFADGKMTSTAAKKLLEYEKNDAGMQLFAFYSAMMMRDIASERELERREEARQMREGIEVEETEHDQSEIHPWSYRLDPGQQAAVVNRLRTDLNISSVDAVLIHLNRPHVWPGFGFAILKAKDRLEPLLRWLLQETRSMEKSANRNARGHNLPPQREPTAMQQGPPMMQGGPMMPPGQQQYTRPQYGPPAVNAQQFPPNPYPQYAPDPYHQQQQINPHYDPNDYSQFTSQYGPPHQY